MKKLLLLALCGVFLFGFSKAFADEPRLEVINYIISDASVQKVVDSLLPNAKKLENFKEAVVTIDTYIVMKSSNESEFKEHFKEYFDGKIADQIIDFAKKHQKEVDVYVKKRGY